MAKKTSDDPKAVINAANQANAGSAPGIVYEGEGIAQGDYGNQPGFGTQVPKHAVAGDPTVMAAPPREQTMERMGGSFRISAGISKPVDPAIASTVMSNTRILPPAIRRSDQFYNAG